jgi:hypothetical protein
LKRYTKKKKEESAKSKKKYFPDCWSRVKNVESN